MPSDPLDTLRMRVEAARMSGQMDDYVRDVSSLIEVVDGQRKHLNEHNAGMEAVRITYGRLKAQASLPDNADRKKIDAELILYGAKQLATAFNAQVGDE